MTKRDKIIEAINSVQLYGIMSNAFGGDLPVTNEMLADALIAAGIGDKSGHCLFINKDGTEIKQLYSCEEVEQIANERDEYKHRAEVAEKDLERHKRALYHACKASGAVLTKELVRARVDCFLRKAEKC